MRLEDYIGWGMHSCELFYYFRFKFTYIHLYIDANAWVCEFLCYFVCNIEIVERTYSCTPDHGLRYFYLHVYEKILSHRSHTNLWEVQTMNSGTSKDKCCHCYIQVMSSNYVTSQHIQELLEASFKIEKISI